MQAYHEYEGRDFQLVGPAEYTYKEIVEFVTDVTMREVPMVDVPIGAARFVGKVYEQMINPYFTDDMMEQMLVDVVAKNDPNLLTFADLEITPVSLDKVAFDYLNRFRRGGHFTLVEGYHKSF